MRHVQFLAGFLLAIVCVLYVSTGYEKPHPQAFLHVLATLGERAAVCMIGDSWRVDIADTRMAGTPAILIRTDHPEAPCCAELSHVMDMLNRVCDGGSHRNDGHESRIVVERQTLTQH